MINEIIKEIDEMVQKNYEREDYFKVWQKLELLAEVKERINLCRCTI